MRSVHEDYDDDPELLTPRATNPHDEEPNPFDIRLQSAVAAEDTRTPRPSSPIMTSERTPLLPSHSSPSKPSDVDKLGLAAVAVMRTALAAVPAVFLGMLLNVLDGVSYGLIIFPPASVFDGFGAIGVSMFFVT